MERVLKGSRIEEIDRKCIQSGIDSKVLMKNAGDAVRDAILDTLGPKIDLRSLQAVVICGSGNNGGDGFVAAKGLIDEGLSVKVYYTKEMESLSEDSRFYFMRLSEVSGKAMVKLDYSDRGQREQFTEDITNADIIVDAIFGTGIHSEVRKPFDDLIRDINSARSKNDDMKVFSIDIPSGIDSDTALVLGAAVEADLTVTLGCAKLGTSLYPGAYFAGKQSIVDIGIPAERYEEYEDIFITDIKWVADNLPLREAWTYKHKVGRLLVLAGSVGMTGAAIMTCQSALRAGAGIVTLVCPWELNNIFETRLTEVMTYPVEQTDDISLHVNSLEEITELSQRFDALAIGPGLSGNPSTICLVREILKMVKKPTVLDADGLKALYGPMDIEKKEEIDYSHLVITPHSGELAYILGDEKIGLDQRFQQNLYTAESFGLTSVLKGASTIITDKDGVTYINPTGNWALATAGTGDILTGIIGSLLCQGMENTKAGICGVFIHGLSADMISEKTSRTSLIATDLIEGIKEVFLRLEKIKYKR